MPFFNQEKQPSRTLDISPTFTGKLLKNCKVGERRGVPLMESLPNLQ
jgi:hypothetical protein